MTTKSESTGVDFYWRPGCGFCMMLDRSLQKIGVPMHKHNIWENPADAAAVRNWANGSETVPTVVIDGLGLVNPTAGDVMAALVEKAPHLVPEDWEPPAPSRVARTARRLLGG